MEMSRVERRKREKNEPKRNKLEIWLVTLRSFADISRIASFLDGMYLNKPYRLVLTNGSVTTVYPYQWNVGESQKG